MNADKNKRLIQRILDFCQEINERIAKYDITEDRFLSDSDISDLLLMPLVQIGELTNKLSDDFIERHAEIPWREINGFRNVVVHDYDGLNLKWAWSDIQQDIPKLEKYCQEILNSDC